MSDPVSDDDLRRLKERLEGWESAPPPREPPRGAGRPQGGSGSGGGGERRGGAPRDSAPPRRDAIPRGGLPEDYLIGLRGGYFDAEGNLRPELIVTQARQVADLLAGRGLSTGALRRFFGLARRAERYLNTGASFPRVRNDLLDMKARAFDAQKRDVVPPAFREFIDENVERAVASERAFRNGFLKHFEYVVAWFPKR